MPGSEFQWLVVVFGMLTGLSLTRLLSGIAATLRSRTTARVDWLPLLWSASLFLVILEYWWDAHDMKSLVTEWTYPEFLRLLASPLLLFLCVALILPVHELKPGETHREAFDSHGRWALIGLSLYYLEFVWESANVWHSAWFNWWGALLLLIILIPTVAFFSPRRINWWLATLYLVIHVLSIFVDFGQLRSW